MIGQSLASMPSELGGQNTVARILRTLTRADSHQDKLIDAYADYGRQLEALALAMADLQFRESGLVALPGSSTLPPNFQQDMARIPVRLAALAALASEIKQRVSQLVSQSLSPAKGLFTQLVKEQSLKGSRNSGRADLRYLSISLQQLFDVDYRQFFRAYESSQLTWVILAGLGTVLEPMREALPAHFAASSTTDPTATDPRPGPVAEGVTDLRASDDDFDGFADDDSQTQPESLYEPNSQDDFAPRESAFTSAPPLSWPQRIGQNLRRVLHRGTGSAVRPLSATPATGPVNPAQVALDATLLEMRQQIAQSAPEPKALWQQAETRLRQLAEPR
ncbi:MAG: hypothetical protein ACRC0L_06045, partial [Angustibacter sp.]